MTGSASVTTGLHHTGSASLYLPAGSTATQTVASLTPGRRYTIQF